MDEYEAVGAYLPRTVLSRAGMLVADPGADRVQRIDGTLLFADVSGFTRLSERLARQGRAGAEVMVGALSTVFGPLVAEIHRHGGDVLKFAGDALVVLFEGEDHVRRGARAAIGLRRTLRSVGSVRTGAGTVRLSMSQGLHVGTFWLVHAGTGDYRDVVLLGPDVAATFSLESAADPGEVLLDAATVSALAAAGGAQVAPRTDGRSLLLWIADDPTAPAGPVEAPLPSSPEVAQAWQQYVPLTLRDRLADAVTDSEHRTVTAAFVQVRGCDDLLARGGPAAVGAALDQLLDSVTDLGRRHRVTVVCVDAGPDGGKLMLASGAPQADEQDADAMLRFCLALVAAPPPGLRLAAGVNRGHVYAGLVGSLHRFTWSTMGDAVNVAARLSGAASPGTVLAAEVVLRHTRDGYERGEARTLTLKGKSELIPTVVVSRAVTNVAGRPERRGAAARRRALIGRSAELSVLVEAAVAARIGHGRLVEVVGEAGAGSSRLIGALLDLVEHPGPGPDGTPEPAAARILRLRCERHDASHAYATAEVLLRTTLGITRDVDPATAGRALLDWLDRYAPQLLPVSPLLALVAGADVPSTDETDALAPQFRVARLQDAVAAALAAASGDPVVLAVEDVGHLDDASRGVLAALARGVADRPWLLVTTRRPGERGLAVDEALPGATAPPTVALEVVLGPLDDVAAAELARSVAPRPMPREDLARIMATAAGNALFLIELIRAWAADGSQSTGALPDSIEAILLARLDRLPGPGRRLPRYASVLGTTVDTNEVVAVLAGAEEGSLLHQAWKVAQDPVVWSALDDLLVPEGGRTRRFDPILLAQVAYDSLPFARRRELHDRAALAMEAAGSRDVALLAHHAIHSGDHERSWRYGRAAAAAARHVYAHAEAAELDWQAVTSAMAGGGRLALDPVLVAATAEQAGDSAEVAGRYALAADAYAVARRLARPADRPRLLGKVGQLAERTGHYPMALRWYTRGLTEVEALAARTAAQDGGQQAGAVTEAVLRRARVDLLVGHAGTRYRQGRYEDVLRDCRRALQIGDEQHDLASLAHAWFLLDAALTDLGRGEEAAPYRERALPVFEATGDLVRQADVLNNLGIDAYYEGRLDESVQLYERSRTARLRAGDVVGAATSANNLAEVLSDQGRLPEAEEAFTEALAVWTQAAYPVGVAVATSNLGRLRTRQGRAAEATILLRRALAGFRDLKAEALAVDTEARIAEALLADGDAAGALSLCDDLLGPRVQVPGVAQVMTTLREVRRQAVEVLAGGRRETGGALPASAALAIGRDGT